MSRPVYEPLVPLASGGMAHVWIGADTATHGTLVALKRARACGDGTREPLDAIMHEAELATKLRHPNLVAVRGVETSVEGGPTLVLEYVEGCTLKQLVERLGKVAPIPVMLRVILDAAKGLAAVHAASIVHRDVTPSNVLVGADGVARLIDFGVSKRAAEVERSSDRVLQGKPAYFAPEYIEGAEPDAACDLFSLGVVAWEALTGRRLFKLDNDVETLACVLHSAVAPPSRVRAGLAPLDAPILRALARDRRARYASVGDLVGTLEAIAAGGDLLATHDEVAACVRRAFGDELSSRRAAVEREIAERRARLKEDEIVTSSVATLSVVPTSTDSMQPVVSTLSAFPVVPHPQRSLGVRMHVMLVAAAVFAFVGLGSAARSLAKAEAPAPVAAAEAAPLDTAPNIVALAPPASQAPVMHIELPSPPDIELEPTPPPRPAKKPGRPAWSPKSAPKAVPPNPYAGR